MTDRNGDSDSLRGSPARDMRDVPEITLPRTVFWWASTESYAVTAVSKNRGISVRLTCRQVMCLKSIRPVVAGLGWPDPGLAEFSELCLLLVRHYLLVGPLTPKLHPSLTWIKKWVSQSQGHRRHS